jgi:digeranylgeranylglycerophospholipid reductase
VEITDEMNEERYDVVVVGAGPAGSVTARIAAEHGLDVLLLDRNQEIGVPVKCAEGAGKEIEQFVTPDKKWISAEVKGAYIYAPDGTKVEMAGEKMEEVGYVLERRLFDKFLASEAARAGAEVRVRTEAYGLIKEDGYAKGVSVRALAEGETKRIYAQVVVGADGVESKVGRWGGINTKLRPSDIDICAEFLMYDASIDSDYNKFFLGSKIAPKGYAWTFPKGEGCANVGVGISGDMSGEGHHAIDYLRAFVHSQFPNGKVLAEMYGAVPVCGMISESVADGLVLVGDAAWQVNPITGGGIIYALHAGEMAGEVIAKAVQENDVSKKRLAEYDTQWRNAFRKRLDIGLKAKEFFCSLSDDDINKLAHSLADIKIHELTTKALLIELIKKNPRMMMRLARTLL